MYVHFCMLLMQVTVFIGHKNKELTYLHFSKPTCVTVCVCVCVCVCVLVCMGIGQLLALVIQPCCSSSLFYVHVLCTCILMSEINNNNNNDDGRPFTAAAVRCVLHINFAQCVKY